MHLITSEVEIKHHLVLTLKGKCMHLMTSKDEKKGYQHHLVLTLKGKCMHLMTSKDEI